MTTQRCNIATETETQTKRQTMTKKKWPGITERDQHNSDDQWSHKESTAMVKRHVMAKKRHKMTTETHKKQ